MLDVTSESCESSSGAQEVQEISAARKGDAAALGALLEACRYYLRYIAQKELGCDLQAKEDASDLVQVTMMKAQGKFQDFQGGDHEALRQWLRKILLNSLKDFYRKYKDAEQRKVSKEVHLDNSSQRMRVEELIADDLTPSKVIMNDEREAALKKALKRLPEDQQRVIYLRSRKHMGYSEISQIMDRSAEAARLLWIRAVERLAAELRQE
ncbi:RNA polymerase sigma factor [Symmachiella dynata]|uniref:ECF RNA polymerase sigma factor SigH n=1 Tax=Symmachiella dynata TaxID=2527995 RepID=A0A517ZPN8_9PLAN|nr:sigma-70 family RNA polymerase sigma factor [Symmachiella dynata]QDT48806.1 ECF RNA polymerase sigma factor SigH [Symmachiella dynata]QDU44438.1 ECF RNA polymerase sigma factor SigH [Symmachiella dynata]